MLRRWRHSAADPELGGSPHPLSEATGARLAELEEAMRLARRVSPSHPPPYTSQPSPSNHPPTSTSHPPTSSCPPLSSPVKPAWADRSTEQKAHARGVTILRASTTPTPRRKPASSPPALDASFANLRERTERAEAIAAAVLKAHTSREQGLTQAFETVGLLQAQLEGFEKEREELRSELLAERGVAAALRDALEAQKILVGQTRLELEGVKKKLAACSGTAEQQRATWERERARLVKRVEQACADVQSGKEDVRSLQGRLDDECASAQKARAVADLAQRELDNDRAASEKLSSKHQEMQQLAEKQRLALDERVLALEAALAKAEAGRFKTRDGSADATCRLLINCSFAGHRLRKDKQEHDLRRALAETCARCNAMEGELAAMRARQKSTSGVDEFTLHVGPSGDVKILSRSPESSAPRAGSCRVEV